MLASGWRFEGTFGDKGQEGEEALCVFVLFYFHDLVFDGRARQSVPDEMITHLLLGVCAAQRGPGGRGTIDERGGLWEEQDCVIMIFGNNGQHIYPLPVVDLIACFCEELNKMDLKKKRVRTVWFQPSSEHGEHEEPPIMLCSPQVMFPQAGNWSLLIAAGGAWYESNTTFIHEWMFKDAQQGLGKGSMFIKTGYHMGGKK